MGFIQDKKTGEWYKEGTTPPWMTEEEAKAEEPKPEAKAEAEPPQEARTIVVNDQEVKIAVESDKAAKEPPPGAPSPPPGAPAPVYVHDVHDIELLDHDCDGWIDTSELDAFLSGNGQLEWLADEKYSPSGLFPDYFVALVKEAAATLEKESLLGLHYSQDEGERIFFHHQAVFAATQALDADDMKELNKAFAIAKKGGA